MSAVPQATQAGAQGSGFPQNSQEDKFQSLFDDGAFEPQGPGAVPAETRAPAGPEASAPAEQSESRDAPAPEAEEPEYTSIEEFLTAQKFDVAAFQSLPITVKIDGETKSVPLKGCAQELPARGARQ